MFLENLCVEMIYVQEKHANTLKYTAIKFMKNFYDQLIFFNCSEILAQLKDYLSKKINFLNFYQWYKPLHPIGSGSFAKVFYYLFF